MVWLNLCKRNNFSPRYRRQVACPPNYAKALPEGNGAYIPKGEVVTMLDRTGRPVRNPAAYQRAITRNRAAGSGNDGVFGRNATAPTTRRGKPAKRLTKKDRELRALDRNDAKHLATFHTRQLALKKGNLAPGETLSPVVKGDVLSANEQAMIKDFVQEQLKATMDVRRTWERFNETYTFAFDSASWKLVDLNLGAASDIVHYKPLLFKFLIVAKVVGNGGLANIALRWLRYNDILVTSTPGNSAINGVQDDYSVNVRDRLVPLAYQPAAPLEYESRFRGIVLHPDEEFQLAHVRNATNGAPGTSSFNVILNATGHYRNVEVGEL